MSWKQEIAIVECADATLIGVKTMSDGMVRGLKDFFKEYNGCRNCRHQPEPMQMCEWGKKRQRVELICSGWEKKDE